MKVQEHFARFNFAALVVIPEYWSVFICERPECHRGMCIGLVLLFCGLIRHSGDIIFNSRSMYFLDSLADINTMTKTGDLLLQIFQSQILQGYVPILEEMIHTGSL